MANRTPETRVTRLECPIYESGQSMEGSLYDTLYRGLGFTEAQRGGMVLSITLEPFEGTTERASAKKAAPRKGAARKAPRKGR
jgi:hypothetical protein